LATVVTIAAFAMVTAAVVLVVPNAELPSFVPLGFFGTAGLIFGVTFPAVGWLIVTRSSASRIGWLFLLIGLSQAIDTFTFQYATFGLLGHPGAVPLPDVAAWVYFWGYFPGLLLFFPALLLFPDGRLPSRYWRPVLWVDAIAALLILPPIVVATWPFRGSDLLLAQTPAVIMESNPLVVALVSLGNLLIPLIALATLLGVVVRFRRSEGIERQQLKWFAMAAAATIVELLFVGAIGIAAPFDMIVAIVEGLILPVAVGIAVLRYRLYDIDLVIRRTLVYVPLTALLAGLYAASIGITQRAFVAMTGTPSDGAVILSTLILAATFTPIKNAIQARVDRAFREAQDAERRLFAFTTAIEDDWATPDPGRTIRAFLAVAIGAVNAGGGEAWLQIPSGEQSIGSSTSRGAAVVSVAVETTERRFGRLDLDARVGGGDYATRDLEVLRAAAGRLATALSGLGITTPVGPRVPASAPILTVDAVE
jgi:hypothetical protein